MHTLALWLPGANGCIAISSSDFAFGLEDWCSTRSTVRKSLIQAAFNKEEGTRKAQTCSDPKHCNLNFALALRGV